MTVCSSGAQGAGRRIAAAFCFASLLLATLAGCTAGNVVGGVAAPASATAGPEAPAAAPAATTRTTAAAPKAEPRVLAPTEINEACWMSSEVNKLKDLDAKAKLVDKCVAEKMKAQGM